MGIFEILRTHSLLVAEKPENSDSGGIAKLFENFGYGLENNLHGLTVSGLVQSVVLLHVDVAISYYPYCFPFFYLHFAQTEILFAHLGGNA